MGKIRQVSKKRAKEQYRYNKARKEAFEKHRHRCVLNRWSNVPCSDVLHPDHIVPLGRGGAYADPNNIWPMCHIDHELKTHVLVTGAEILGLYGLAKQDQRRNDFLLENPEATDLDWQIEVNTWMRVWDAEKRYMKFGVK